MLHNDHATIEGLIPISDFQFSFISNFFLFLSLSDLLEKAKLQLESWEAVVVAVVGDNHSGIQKAIALLCEKFPEVSSLFEIMDSAPFHVW